MSQTVASEMDAVDPSIASEDSVAWSGRRPRLRRAPSAGKAPFLPSPPSPTPGREIEPMLAEMHRIVLGLLPAQVFLVALREPGSSAVRVVASTPALPSDPEHVGPDADDVAATLARKLARERASFRGDGRQLGERFPDLVPLGMEEGEWLAVSIPGEDAPDGALVLLAAPGGEHFRSLDQALLEFVAGQIHVALRLRAEDEPQVSERADDLMQEVIDHQRRERLQAALFSIGELAGSNTAPERFYAAVHDIIGDVLDCRNLCVAQLSPDRALLDFPYYVNDREPIPHPHPPGAGLNEWVLRHRAPLNVDLGSAESRAKLSQLVAGGELQEVRSQPGAWLGVPLVCANEVIGVVSVQSYAPDPPYDERDEEFLAFLPTRSATCWSASRPRFPAAGECDPGTARGRTHAPVAEPDGGARADRAAAQARDAARLPHRPAEPRLPVRPPDALAGAAVARRVQGLRGAVHGPGPLQGDQRLRRPHRRRRAAEGSRQAAADLRAHAGHGRAPGWRRIRHPDRGRRHRRHRDQGRAAHHRGPAGADLRRRQGIVHLCQHRHRHQRARVPPGRGDAARRRHRDVPRQGQRRAAFYIFNESLHLEAIRVLETEGDLHRAIARQEFEPYFQAIVRLDTGAPIGFESLLRWNHPSAAC
jgi:GAF domain-containing protein